MSKNSTEKPYSDDDGEVRELDRAWFDQAVRINRPKPKQAISLRFDQHVLDYFKSGGPGYQSRMQAVLAAYVRAQLKLDAKAKKTR